MCSSPHHPYEGLQLHRERLEPLGVHVLITLTRGRNFTLGATTVSGTTVLITPKRGRNGLSTYTDGMACRISELVIAVADPDRLAAFWSEVLGYVELGREDDGSIEIGPPDVGFGGLQPTLILSPSSEPRAGKLRLHIDVNATDRDQDAELERLLALGARPVDVGQTGAENWHVLADPEGNEFCLLRARLQPL